MSDNTYAPSNLKIVKNKVNKDVQEKYKHILLHIGENPDRNGLLDTPKRVIKALEELTWGLRKPEEEFLEEISRKFELAHDQMISVRNIRFSSLCEHHMLPFIGTATVAYIPRTRFNTVTSQPEGKVIGISKLARLVEYYAARPQIQERLTAQIADALQTLLKPDGIGVWLDAVHTCMSIRGIKSVDSSTVTSDLRGAMKNNADTRNEFLALARHNTFGQ